MTAPTCLLALSLLVASVPSPHTPITPASMPPPPAVRSHAEARRLADRLTISGSAVLIASGAGWGLMLSGMALGAYDRRRHNELVDTINAADRPPRPSERAQLVHHDRQGARANTNAIAGAILTAAMTIVGAALLGRGLVLKKRQGRLAPLRVAAIWRPAL